MKLTSHAPIRIGPFTLHLAFENDNFAGIGRVCFENTPLRSETDTLPWSFYTESENGVRFSRFELLGIDTLPDGGATIRFASKGEWLPRIQEADAMGEARIKPRRAHMPTATFAWTFRPIREQIWENTWQGFAMTLAVSSPENPIHWIIEDTTWEIGGAAAGVTLIQQDISTIDLEQKVTVENAFSTIEKFFTTGWGGSYPMDMLPRAAGSSICDFQTRDDLALCLFFERPSLTRARIDKLAGENVVHYTDRPYFPLTENARTPERKLLVYRHPDPLKRHERRNLWLDCFTDVRRRILAPFDFQPEIPQPSVHAHLWDDDLKRLGKNWLDAFQAALPLYQKMGFKQVITHAVWDSITSDPSPAEPGNICCPYQFKFAEMFGGAEGFRRFSEAAAALGIDVFQWFSFHLARHAPVWKEHPDWVCKEANGDPWDGNYGVLWSGRFRSDYGKWMEDTVTQSCKDAKLPGVFWDSYQNLGIDCIDWSAPDKAPQAEEIWRFQSRLQKQGIKQRCEITTIFGVTAVAMFGFQDDRFRRRLWWDTVRDDSFFALMDTSPAFFSGTSYTYGPGRIEPADYFKFLAHRAVPTMSAMPWRAVLPPDNTPKPTTPGGDQGAEFAAINHLYNEALPRMKRLRLVEDGTHVLWLDDENRPSVIWVFRDATVNIPPPSHGKRARELSSGRIAETSAPLAAKTGEVWILE